MPMQDSQLQLSSAQLITATAFSTNTIDLASSPLGLSRDVGAGNEVSILFRVGTTFTAAGAATLALQLVTSANANLSSPTIIAQSDAIPKAALVAGAQILVPVPRVFVNLQLGQRYFGVQYTVATGPMTAGAIDASLIIDGANIVTGGAIYPFPTSPNGVPSGFSVK